MRYIALTIVAVMLFSFPLFAQEENAGAPAAADANAAAGCQRLNLGSWEGMETEEEQAAEGEAVTDEEYMSDAELYEQSQQEGQPQQQGQPQQGAGASTEELLCEENPNPDGTLTCYEGEKALICQVQGEQVLCPE